jgi:uncharacterized protein YndB with AHSA1/START domain
LDTQQKTHPSATAEMFIRRPVAEVFEAFANPEITTRFWFTRSTGRLEAGRQVEWFWEMYGVSVLVDVLAVEPGEKIVISWGNQNEHTTVEWTFTDVPNTGTFVRIVNTGFRGTPHDIVAQVDDAAGGFNLLLAGAKAWLEHGIQLNLTGDKFPEEMRSAQ